VITRTKDPLQVKQRLMRARQRALPKTGRPKKKPTDDPKFRNRVAALVLLQEGRSVEFVAATLQVPPEAVKRWVERGMPIIGDWPVKGLSLD
jgi:hypothetical protein